MHSKLYKNDIYKYNIRSYEQKELIWQLKDPGNTSIGNIRNGVVKHNFDKCIYFSELAGREDLNGYAPDMEEFAHVRFSDKDICSVVIKIKINDDTTTPDNTRILAINSHFWWLEETWQFVSPNTVGIKLKTYIYSDLKKIMPDREGNITLVQVTDIWDMLSGSSNYDSDLARAISLNIRIDRIKTGDTRGGIFTSEIEPNNVNNVTFALKYIGVYNGDVSYMESIK